MANKSLYLAWTDSIELFCYQSCPVFLLVLKKELQYSSTARPSYQISSVWPKSRAIVAGPSGVPAVDQERECFCGEHLPHQNQTRLSGTIAGTSCGKTPSVFVKAHTAEEPIICAAVHMPDCVSHD